MRRSEGPRAVPGRPQHLRLRRDRLRRAQGGVRAAGGDANSSPAMALNGGIAYSGGTCGAVTGAALAVGMLSERRGTDHLTAKRAARLVTADLLAAFEAEFGTSACRELIGLDLRTDAGHRAFVDGGIWRDRCMRQLEMVVVTAGAPGRRGGMGRRHRGARDARQRGTDSPTRMKPRGSRCDDAGPGSTTGAGWRVTDGRHPDSDARCRCPSGKSPPCRRSSPRA